MAVLCLAACRPRGPAGAALPPGLTVEEYELKAYPELEPLAFDPVLGTQQEILSKHTLERADTFPDNSFFVDYRPGLIVQTGTGALVAIESFTTGTVTSSGVFQKVTVEVSRGSNGIYTIPAGDSSPINTLQGLWAFSDHWVLEIAHVDQHISGNEISLDSFGQVIQDGVILNDRYGYQEAFGFQLMNGKPFYFFKRDGRIGISYDNQEVPLGYDQIPHYGCCSAAVANPRHAQRMMAFFAQRDSKWYYVEIGAYK